MKKLYFVRHGLSVMNQQGIFSGRTNVPLAPEGVAQCHAAGQRLQDAGITCIVASPMKRTVDTAVIIAEELGYPIDRIIVNELFMERSFGPLEGTVYAADMDLDGTKGVEHSDDLISRSREGLEFLRSLDSDVVLVVSHGAVGRALRHLLHPETPYYDTAKFTNGEIVQLLP